MRQIGIWIDKDKAFIIDHETNIITKIASNIEHFSIHGGSGTRLKGGPQDVVQDSKYLEREKHQLRIYFRDIASKVQNVDSIVIFGPADTGLKFLKDLEKSNKMIHKNVITVAKADSMTQNQLKAWVRDFYNTNRKNEF